MVSVTKSVDVEAPLSTVYNQWTQFEDFPQFMGGVDQITAIDDTHTHWVTSIGGQRREFDTEITEQHPDERVAWKSTDGTTHAGVITFHRLWRHHHSGHRRKIDWQPEGLVEKVGSALNFDDRPGEFRPGSVQGVHCSPAARNPVVGAVTCRPMHDGLARHTFERSRGVVIKALTWQGNENVQPQRKSRSKGSCDG